MASQLEVVINQTNERLEAALEFAQRGWPVLPVHSVQDGACTCGKADCDRPGKHPATPHGYKDATTNFGKINSWFSEGLWNIGIRTGRVSNLFVLDADSPDVLKKFGVPVTPISETPRGRHYLFAYPSGLSVTRAVIDDKLEVLGDRCYTIEPPSVGREWVIPPYGEFAVEPAPAPVWLLEMLKNHRAGPKAHTRDIASIVHGVPQGRRNVSATKVAGKLLGAFEPADWETFAWPLLHSWNALNKPPLSERELRNVFESIARREAAKRAATDTKRQRVLRVALKHSKLSFREIARKAQLSKSAISRLASECLTSKRLTSEPPW